MTYLDQVAQVHAEFSRRLGRVAVAGGAVRDALISVHPKDYDVFVFDRTKDEIEAALADLSAVVLLPWHASEPFLVKNVEWQGMLVQVMRTTHEDTIALLDSFDWNVSCYAFDEYGVLHGTGVEEPHVEVGVGKELKLHKVTYPTSTLRRGFRFSERFHMILPQSTIERLALAIVVAAEKREEAKDGQTPA